MGQVLVLLSIAFAAAEAQVPVDVIPMEFVVVGDVGNPPDPDTNTGSVGYKFEIGKYEVSNAHYAEFLNAIARTGDPYELYSVNMERGLFGGIKRNDHGDGYTYEPLEGYENLPVVYATWFSMARFCNWLHYGKPTTGESVLGTTEGTPSQGAYATSLIPEGKYDRSGEVPILSHNAEAKFWLPTIDEWNKAAFYDPSKSGPNKYWLYATQSDEKPLAVPPGDSPNSANYYDYKFASSDPFLTPIGGYTQSPSYYGTFDQAGNVFEWIGSPRLHNRAYWVRGGAVTTYSHDLQRTTEDSEYPDHRIYIFGFRVCKAHDSSSDSGENN